MGKGALWMTNMVFFGKLTKEPVLVGQVDYAEWIDPDGTYHLDDLSSGVGKAFIIGMHTLCPVFHSYEIDTVILIFVDSMQDSIPPSTSNKLRRQL